MAGGVMPGLRSLRSLRRRATPPRSKACGLPGAFLYSHRTQRVRRGFRVPHGYAQVLAVSLPPTMPLCSTECARRPLWISLLPPCHAGGTRAATRALPALDTDIFSVSPMGSTFETPHAPSIVSSRRVYTRWIAGSISVRDPSSPSPLNSASSSR